MRFLPRCLLAFAAIAAHAAGAAEPLRIAAAADLKFCMDEIVQRFESAHAGASVDVSYGSSGNFAAQIRQGAPFDLFFSADSDYPRALAQDGFAASGVEPYAIGRIALWSATLDATKLTIAALGRADIATIAIANPRHAPYGRRAEEALRASGVWDAVQDKLVYGENIAQAAQFAASGNATVGVISLSLALSPALAAKGGYSLVPDSLHTPLQQAFIVTRHGAGNALARAFADGVRSREGRTILARHGFSLPDGRTAP